MSFAQSSTSLLAVAVRQFPCLWKISDENFGNFEKCRLAWEEICASIGIYKQETVLQLKKTWKCELNEFLWAYRCGKIDWTRWTPFLYLVQSINWDEFGLQSMKMAMVANQMIEGRIVNEAKATTKSCASSMKQKNGFPFLKKNKIV